VNISQFNRILIQTLLLPVIVLGFVAVILVWQVRGAQRTVATIQASDESIAAATRAQKLVVDEETGLRGYQITSDPQFLSPFHTSEIPFAEAMDLLRHNLIAQHESPKLVDSIVAAQKTWRVSYAEPLIAEIAAGGDTRDVERNIRGKQRMDDLRNSIEAVLDRENTIRAQEAARWSMQGHATIRVLVVLALVTGIFISVFSVSRLQRVSSAYQGTLNGLRLHSQATFESEERLRTTLTSIGDGVIVCDPDGRVELLNTVAQELTGWTQTDAFRRPLEEVFHIVHETTREPVETPVAKVKRLQSVVGLASQTVLIRPDGSEILVDDSGAPIYDRSGALSGIVMVFRDITSARRAQNALLATEKLAVAGRLAATIAHEIHNPLDSVVNLLYLMQEEKDPETSAHYLELAQQELGRMGQVSRAMLGLYREARTPIAIDVKEMLQSVLVLLDRQIRNAQLIVETELAESVEIEGFPAELRQVFTNLIANSADAASPGGSLSLTSRRGSAGSAPARPGVCIQVSDNGSGIEPAALEHIFEPFFTTKGEFGTGLGLWVSRGIIEKHGGTIEIRSQTGSEDHGTTITVFLPRTGPAAAGARQDTATFTRPNVQPR
jgi:PAS domain S-box-containing protein